MQFCLSNTVSHENCMSFSRIRNQSSLDFLSRTRVFILFFSANFLSYHYLPLLRLIFPPIINFYQEVQMLYLGKLTSTRLLICRAWATLCSTVLRVVLAMFAIVLLCSACFCRFPSKCSRLFLLSDILPFYSSLFPRFWPADGCWCVDRFAEGREEEKRGWRVLQQVSQALFSVFLSSFQPAAFPLGIPPPLFLSVLQLSISRNRNLQKYSGTMMNSRNMFQNEIK